VRHAHVAIEIEHHPVHPASAEEVEPGQLRVGLLHLIGRQDAHHLDRHGGDVEVCRVLQVAPVRHDADVAHGLARCVDGLHLVFGLVVDPQGAKMGQPWVYPDVIGRTLEDPIHLVPRPGEVEQQLEEDAAPGPGAHLASLGGHQRSGQTVGQEFAVLGRAGLRPRELPPALMLVLGEAPLLAAGHQKEQNVDEVGLVSSGDPERRRLCE